MPRVQDSIICNGIVLSASQERLAVDLEHHYENVVLFFFKGVL